MNKYSRQLRIGCVFIRRASSGRKYAILADFTQCLVTQCLTLFYRLLSPFLRCRTGFFALRKSPFHVAIWYVRHRHTGNLAMRKSLFRPPSSHLSPPVSPKTLSRHPFSCSLTHIFHHILFKGTYTQQYNLIPDGSYLLSGGQWYYMDLKGGKVTSVKGFRTWLEPAGDTAGKNMQFSVDGVIDGGATNAIEGIVGDSQTKTDNKVYNMNGQVVRNNSASLEGLPKGVYIVNNKKYIVK